MKEDLYIVKIGGHVIDIDSNLKSFLSDFSKIEAKKILVHGGGKIATKIGNKLGIKPNYHNGRRITDDDTIDLVTMVYGGLINKKIVSSLNAFGNNAIGLSGADANLILAHRRPIKDGIDFGWVGDIDQVNHKVLNDFLTTDQLPVIAPLTCDDNGQLLNTNADTIASEIASSLADKFNTQLIYCFEKNGVLKDIEDDNSLVPTINTQAYNEMRQSSLIHEGMLPKMSNAFSALERGVTNVIIGHSKHIILLTQTGFTQCTRINL